MRLTALVILFVFTVIARAETLADQIDALLAAKLPDANVGILVQRMNDNSHVYARNVDQLFIPASVAKILSTYVAVKALDFDYTFNTQLSLDNDNLYIRFVGDPSFTTQDLHTLLDPIKTQKIKNIVIDDTVFEKPYYARGWSYSSIHWYYSAPISSVILDKNTVRAVLTPAKVIGDPATVKLDENAQHIILNSQIYTATELEAETTCQLNASVTQDNVIDLFGCWPISDKPKKLGIALSDPNLYVKNAIHTYLLENNIKISGAILVGKTPKKAKLIATHQSPPLMETAKLILQDSSNFYTEPYVKVLGQKFYKQASFQAGSYAVQQQLHKQLDIDPEQMLLYDGSGASAYNRLTPQAIATVLQAAYFDKSIQPAFRNALAKPGESGSLKRRMKTLPAEAEFAGKTGTLTHTSTLAGTLIHPNRVPLVVVIMINGASQKSAYNKQVEDEIIALIYQAPVAQLDSASPS